MQSPDFPPLHTVHATFIRTRRSIELLLSHVEMCITSLHAIKCSHILDNDFAVADLLSKTVDFVNHLFVRINDFHVGLNRFL